ncbi:HemK protein (plasmid) [Legionella adelaidensis]|uniref:Release factor glutamine methyltransferase n=1 Tax=Legionella adelaidensis TaxID=45056 RepID=A0A0W0R2V3_9GAMM|nr:peptide chain release factor N(5)-glutamine methyltransferase [Legionella adelaidensis]KTC65396.1 protein methyltransferase HemK [Legionella adelaidensis]VEH84782.1 HemK protein [Legionella adelaidensis]
MIDATGGADEDGYTIKTLLQNAVASLAPFSSTAQIDAEILLAFVIQKNRTFLYTYPELKLNKQEAQIYINLVQQRKNGLPIAYIISQRDFWSFTLKVTPDTLIPRPETELLVEIGLKLLSDKEQAKVLDLGTGTGAIAIALGLERPHWKILAVDKNLKALAVAIENAKDLEVTNILFAQSDWFSDVGTETFDLIVSNPPYIAENDPHLGAGDLRFEPQGALISGDQGLSDISTIIDHSVNYLSPGGVLLIEHGFEQRKAIFEKLSAKGYKEISCWQDYEGRDRCSGGRKPL